VLHWLTWIFEISLAGLVVNAEPRDCGLARCFNVSCLDFIVGFQCDPPKLAQSGRMQNEEMLKAGGGGSHLVI